MSTSRGASEPTNEQRAMEYYKHAAEFTDLYGSVARAEAEQALPGGSAIGRDLHLTSAKLLLVGHALELTLKGWLVLKEGTPVSLTKQRRKEMQRDEIVVPKTLMDYSHDLLTLATAVANYYAKLEPYLASSLTRRDMNGQPHTMGIIEYLNTSYWGGGARAYEYPEASDNPIGGAPLAFISPIDTFVDFVNTCRADLLAAIIEQYGGTVPPQYLAPSSAPPQP